MILLIMALTVLVCVLTVLSNNEEVLPTVAKYRKKESRRTRNRYFPRTASRTHFKNIKPRPQRGGIRL